MKQDVVQMSDKEQDAIPVHKSISAALAAAQSQMGKAFKNATNPHFQKAYADLASVMDACIPALTANGIAVIQPTAEVDGHRVVKTIFIHGDTGETLECETPLIVAKNDMQGYGSAVTYGRRYGLMCMAGIAPEDDDGNAATKNPPKAEERDPGKVRDGLLSAIAKRQSGPSLHQLLDGQQYKDAMAWLRKVDEPKALQVASAANEAMVKLDPARQAPNADLDMDEVPY